MLKTLSAQIKQYKKSTILTPIFAALEVVMEVLIPMAMARLVKYGIEGGDTGAIYRTVGYHMWLMGIGPEYTVPVASFIFGLYIMDNVLSIRSAFQLSHRLDKLQKIQQEIRQHLDEKAQLYGNRVEELTVRLMNGLEKASDEYLQERVLRLAQLRSGADMFERRLLRSHPNLRSKRHGKLIDVLRQKKDGVVKK